MRAHMLSCKKWVADFGGAAVLRGATRVTLRTGSVSGHAIEDIL